MKRSHTGSRRRILRPAAGNEGCVNGVTIAQYTPRKRGTSVSNTITQPTLAGGHQTHRERERHRRMHESSTSRFRCYQVRDSFSNGISTIPSKFWMVPIEWIATRDNFVPRISCAIGLHQISKWNFINFIRILFGIHLDFIGRHTNRDGMMLDYVLKLIDFS